MSIQEWPRLLPFLCKLNVNKQESSAFINEWPRFSLCNTRKQTSVACHSHADWPVPVIIPKQILRCTLFIIPWSLCEYKTFIFRKDTISVIITCILFYYEENNIYTSSPWHYYYDCIYLILFSLKINCLMHEQKGYSWNYWYLKIWF